MIAVILAGGRGTRLTMPVEKPLLVLNGTTLLDRALAAVNASRAEACYVATSPATPKTRDYCMAAGIPFIETAGRGYHEDLMTLLGRMPVFLSVAVDVPFLTAAALDTLIAEYSGTSLTGCIPAELMPDGRSASHVFKAGQRTYYAVGVNVVTETAESAPCVFDDALLGININTRADLVYAEKKKKEL